MSSSETRRERVVWMAAVVILIAIAAFFDYRLSQRTASTGDVVRFSVAPPDKTAFPTNNVLDPSAPAISPDGRLLAFVAYSLDGVPMLWLRPVNALVPQPVAGSENARVPFWSPQSDYLGFFADGVLKKFHLATGSIDIVCRPCFGVTGTWSINNLIVFAVPDGSGLRQVSASGGEPTALTSLDLSKQETAHLYPRFLGDGRRFLFGVTGKTRDAAVYITSPGAAEPTLLISGALSAQLVESGHMLFLRGNGVLLSQQFDSSRQLLLGSSQVVAENVVAFSASDNGILALRSDRSRMAMLTWFDRSGQVVGSIGGPGYYSAPAISPDGLRVAYARLERDNSDLWIWNSTTRLSERWTSERSSENCPAWSPDGRRVAFSSDRQGHYDIYSRTTDGAGTEELLLDKVGEDGALTSAWSSDGTSLFFFKNSPQTKWDLAVLRLDGRNWMPVLETRFSEFHQDLSKDGRWLAYTSDESGATEVYVQSYPDPKVKVQVSSGGGLRPKWNDDGRELFYLTETGYLVAVPVAADGTVYSALKKKLFHVDLSDVVTGATCTPYDIAGNGQRFLFTTALEDISRRPFTVIVNWVNAAGK